METLSTIDAALVEAIIDNTPVEYSSRKAEIFNSNEWLKAYFIDGMSASEISKCAGLSASTVSSHWHEACRRMYRALAENEELCERIGLRTVAYTRETWFGPLTIRELYLNNVLLN